MDRKVKTAALSIVSNTTLIILKVIAGILSGSISIISEAIHSGMDLVASIIAFFSVKESNKPADAEHPFGHGKTENVSALFEGALIFIAAGLIISEAVKKLLHPGPIENSELAMAVMGISALVNFLVSRRLYKVGREEDSMALVADGLHLKTDVLTSLGVGIGILLITLTDITYFDPIAALLVAGLIIKEAWHLCAQAVSHILDHRMDDKEEEQIRGLLERYVTEGTIRSYHKLKTRKAGSERHIDFHICLDPQKTIEEGHTIVGYLKRDIGHLLISSRVSVHVDPWLDASGEGGEPANQ